MQIIEQTRAQLNIGVKKKPQPSDDHGLCADEVSYQKAQEHLKETGGIRVSARQIQRLVQSVGPGAQTWQEREALAPLPGTQRASIMYLSADILAVIWGRFLRFRRSFSAVFRSFAAFGGILS